MHVIVRGANQVHVYVRDITALRSRQGATPIWAHGGSAVLAWTGTSLMSAGITHLHQTSLDGCLERADEAHIVKRATDKPHGMEEEDSTIEDLGGSEIVCFVSGAGDTPDSANATLPRPLP